MSFYGEMPDMFNLVLNSDHKLVKEVLADEEKECSAAIAPIQTELEDVTKRRDALKKSKKARKTKISLLRRKMNSMIWIRNGMS